MRKEGGAAAIQGSCNAPFATEREGLDCNVIERGSLFALVVYTSIMLKARKRKNSKPVAGESGDVQSASQRETTTVEKDMDELLSEEEVEEEEAFLQEQVQAGRMQFLLDLGHP